jgi:hypothetical protein
MFETLHHMPVSTCRQLRSSSNAKLAVEAMGAIIPLGNTCRNTTRLGELVSRYGHPCMSNSRNCLT